MIIKKCDVCGNETDALYDKSVATHIDTINGIQYIRQNKLHICRVCMKEVTDIELNAQLEWYNGHVNEDTDGDDNPDDGTSSDGDTNSDGNSDDNNGQNSEDTGGTDDVTENQKVDDDE